MVSVSFFLFFSVESRQALSLSCCSILSSVDKFKNRVSANQYHMTISWAQDSVDDGGVPRQRFFCEKALNERYRMFILRSIDDFLLLLFNN